MRAVSSIPSAVDPVSIESFTCRGSMIIRVVMSASTLSSFPADFALSALILDSCYAAEVAGSPVPESFVD